MFFLKQLLSSNKEIFLVLLAVSLIGTGRYIYHKGYTSGSAYVQEKWNKEKEQTKIKMLELQIQYSQEREQFSHEKELELQELKQKMSEQEALIASINASYADSLQQSEARSAVYQRKATASESERRSLAAHTARLDKALTEGIRLVKELAGTVKFRDEQLRFIGKYLEDTYKLIGKENGK